MRAAVSFYFRPLPDGVWENKVTVRSTRWARMYAPGDFIERVSPSRAAVDWFKAHL